MADNERNQGSNNQDDNRSKGMGQDSDQSSQQGKGQGKENNPGNFANDREKASRAGKKGGSR